MKHLGLAYECEIALVLAGSTAAFVFFTIAGVANLFRWAQSPDGYRIHVLREVPPFPYPWDDVLRLSTFMLLHAVAIYFILRPESYYYIWKRALAAFGVEASTFGLLLPLSMHAPPSVCWFLAWVLTDMR